MVLALVITNSEGNLECLVEEDKMNIGCSPVINCIGND